MCPWCGSGDLFYLHGHIQCGQCGKNVNECCQGEREPLTPVGCEFVPVCGKPAPTVHRQIERMRWMYRNSPIGNRILIMLSWGQLYPCQPDKHDWQLVPGQVGVTMTTLSQCQACGAVEESP
jgi:hypothetical protein